MVRMVKVWQLGRLSYFPALKLQKFLANLHNENCSNPDTVLLVEHCPVYTTGIRTEVYNAEEEKRLLQTGAEFHRTNRGGLITFHGPGQLVVYPILNLNNYNAGVRWYVSSIEKTIIELCKSLGLDAQTSPHTGVWIEDNKVCAIGIQVRKFITTHGLALNCCTDLSWFNHIVPCGIQDKGVTTLTKELGRVVTIEEIVPLFLEHFSEVFDCCYADFPKDQADGILSTIKQS